jgi:signal transduction histidine kinase/GAF domain-containing protein
MEETLFNYVRASEALVSTLVDHVERRESTVLLSYRNGGKMLLARRLADALRRRDLGPVVFVKLQGANPIGTIEDFQTRLVAAIREAGYEVPIESNRDVLSPLDWLRAATDKPPIVVATNVDSMAQTVAVPFLKGVRSRVDAREMIAILTGEYDLRELVHGPNSEFNVVHQYVLQGLDWDLFQDESARYAATLQVHFESEEAQRELWNLTGGNAYVLRVILWAIVEYRVKGRHLGPVTGAGVREWMRVTPILGINEAHLLRVANRLIPVEPDVWANLRRLTIDGEAKLKNPFGPPGALTMSGMAKRENGQLEFASPVMAELARSYYDDLGMGDLFAGVGDWDEAFSYYRRVNRSRLVRPTNSEDIPRFSAVVNSLAAALHTKAAEGCSEVRRLFEDACCHLLGFPEATFWERETGEKWRVAWKSSPSQRAQDSVDEILRLSNGIPDQVLKVSPYWDGAVFAATLTPQDTGGQLAVIVGDFENKQHASRSRRRLLEEQLLPHFMRAHSHASDIEKVKSRLSVRNQHATIINSITSRLGTQVLDIREVLRDMAIGMKTRDYKRIAFALIDEKGEFIEGVIDHSDDPTIDLAPGTKWPLTPSNTNIHPFVVSKCEPEIVLNAWEHPLTNKNAVQRAGITAFALIPLLHPNGHPLGTMHVERVDKQPPSREEVDDFLNLGRQVAALIENAGRVNLLQKALDRVPDPLMIFDPQFRVRYANHAASRLVDLAARWYDPVEAQECKNLGGLRADIETALTFKPSFRHFKGIGSNPSFSGAASCDPIPDWRDRVAGAVLHIQDWSYAWKLAGAFRLASEAADTDELLRALTTGLNLLGHDWGRLYLVTGEGSDLVLQSTISFGLKDPATQEKFDRGGFRLPPRRTSGEESWACLEDNIPVVFCCQSDESNSSGEQDVIPKSVNQHGVIYRRVSNPHCPPGLEKRPNDWWVDFPLIAGSKRLGKITLQSTKDITNEHFEFLRILCNLVSELMEAFERRASVERQRQAALKTEIGHRSLALVCHNIATRFAGLDALIERYRGRSKRKAANNDLTEQLFLAYNDIYAMLERVKLRTKILRMEHSRFDLVAVINSLLQERLPEDRRSIIGPGVVEVEADRQELTTAFREILQNAAEIVPSEALKIKVIIQDIQGYVRVTFEDNGPGVPTELKEKIFDYFFTERNGRTPGTGLGLAYVRRVVEEHSGRILETGKPGSGARFEIELPLRQEHPEGKE